MSDSDVGRLSAHVAAHAGRYFPDLADRCVDAHLVGRSARYRSTLYRFALTAGDARHDVVVKVTSGTGPRSHGADGLIVDLDRPRLVPPTAGEVRHKFEYRAATAAYEHFVAVGDARLTVVRTLDHLPELNALVAEFVEDRTLRDLVVRSVRLRSESGPLALESAFRNTGAWLREFHRITRLPADPLRSTGDSVVACFDEVASFLADRTGRAGGLFARIQAVTAERVPEMFPGGVPLGLGHGDFAPRNVFIGCDGRVRVFDVLGRFRVPIYEDLAHFRIALRTAAVQMATFGRALKPDRLVRYEGGLVAGYFEDDAVPEPALALFELLVLLEKWGSVVVTAPTLDLPRRLLWSAYRAVATPQFGQQARNLLIRVESA